MLQCSIPEYATTCCFSHISARHPLPVRTPAHAQLARAKRRGRCAAWWGDRRRSVCTSLQHVTAALVKVRLVQPVLLGHERREHVRARLLEVAHSGVAEGL